MNCYLSTAINKNYNIILNTNNIIIK